MARIFPSLKRRLLGREKVVPPPRLEAGVLVEFDRDKDVLVVRDHDSFQGRNSATVALFMQAFRTVRDQVGSFRVVLNTGDHPAANERQLQFAYCRSDDFPDVVLMPDFVFWAWPEVGISDYSALTSEMLAAGAEKPADDRLFWIGNPYTHESRQAFLRLAEGNPAMKVQTVDWQTSATSGQPGDDAMLEKGSQYVSLPDHCRYRYLIDLQGLSYSARLKVLLFSQRLVFVQERPWREFFFDDLVPFRHYVPVMASLEDLDEKLDWARTHEAEAEEIVAAATTFARERLTRRAAIEHFRKLILDRFGA